MSMKLTDSQLQKFKQIYKEKFGKTLSDKEAISLSIPLVNLYTTISKELRAKYKIEIKKYETSDP